MKKLLIIIDGMDDEPNPALGNLTPSHFAYMPALQYMREKGNVSWQNTIPSGYQAGTEVAVLDILGYDIPKDFCTRSWFEALGYGLEVKNGDLCLRCNLISHSDGILTSHCGSEVSPWQCHEIVDILNDRFGSEKIEFINCGNFRNLLIVHETEASIKAEAPHEVSHIRELLMSMLKEKINLEITVQSDHGTSSISGLHLDTPVEVVRYILIRDEK